ncbi:Kinesin- protein 6 [Irineochytrium annulatum]|nr:Kinesin- protein 6 [Irineochytrium annulatum]
MEPLGLKSKQRVVPMGTVDNEEGSPQASSTSSTPLPSSGPAATQATQSNVRIFVRVRPPRPNSKLKATPGRVHCVNPETSASRDAESAEKEPSRIGFQVPKDEAAGLINNQKESYDYRFHRVFDQKSTQEEVFDYVAKDVILSVLDGYNGTIFAYGQTGSGKTFTITGGAERYADRGLIPRALQFIFQEGKKRAGFQFDVAISYLEIYNENGYDLLDSSRDAKKLEDLPSIRSKVRLMEDSDSTIHLQNLSTVPAVNEEEALNQLFVGDTNRMIAETPSNPASSRSHCIFIITITSRAEGGDRVRRSKLHLVDLAGSERTSRTGIQGKLFTEASYINLSLHYLEQVIVALYEKGQGKRSHVPYRNSMMTSVLRDSLGGNCMTTMIATVAPEDELIDESISTCRFAQRVALISNMARVNEEVDPKLLIAKLRREIARLKAELAIARGEGANGDEDLPGYEKERSVLYMVARSSQLTTFVPVRIKQAVDDYIADHSPDAALVFSDFRKINEAFRIMKQYILAGGWTSGGGKRDTAGPEMQSESGGPPSADVKRLKVLLANRDNEINILIALINQYKQQLGDNPMERKSVSGTDATFPRSSTLSSTSQPNLFLDVAAAPSKKSVQQAKPPPATDLSASQPRYSKEKGEAFKIFVADYHFGGRIEDQKSVLKEKYAQAKALGEEASKHRKAMAHFKQLFNEADEMDLAGLKKREEIRVQLADHHSKFREAYQRLKECKIEVEHLQHLLEQARLRLTRDFEHWFVTVHLAGELEAAPAEETGSGANSVGDMSMFGNPASVTAIQHVSGNPTGPRLAQQQQYPDPIADLSINALQKYGQSTSPLPFPPSVRGRASPLAAMGGYRSPLPPPVIGEPRQPLHQQPQQPNVLEDFEAFRRARDGILKMGGTAQGPLQATAEANMAANAAMARLTGGNGYSKWDKLELSDDEDFECQRDKIGALKLENECNARVISAFSTAMDTLKTGAKIADVTGPLVSSLTEWDDKLAHDVMVQAHTDRDSRWPPPTPDPFFMKRVQLKDVAKALGELTAATATAGLPGAQVVRMMTEVVASLNKRTKEVEKEVAKEEEEMNSKITTETIREGFSKTVVSKPVTKEEKPEKELVTIHDPSGKKTEGSTATAETAIEAEDDETERYITNPHAERFSRLSGVEESYSFLGQHPELAVPKYSDEILAQAFNLEMSGEPGRAKQCVHQSLMLQYCHVLGKDGIMLFFMRLKNPQHSAREVFMKDVADTYLRISNRVKELKKQEKEKEDEEKRQAEARVAAALQEDGTYALPVTEESTEEDKKRAEVFATFPASFQKAILTQDVDEINGVLAELKESAEEMLKMADSVGLITLQVEES